MANRKISQLVAITALASGDYFPVVQGVDTSNKRVGVDVFDSRYLPYASGLAIGDALASGNAALLAASEAQTTANNALTSGNAALSGLDAKYNKSGGPISGPVVVESQVYGAVAGPIVVSGGVELNLGASNNWDLTLNGPTEFLNPVNASGGQCGVITVRQDSVGSRTAAFSGYWNFPAGTAPTLTTTASGVDILAFYCSSPTEVQVIYNLDFS